MAGAVFGSSDSSRRGRARPIRAAAAIVASAAIAWSAGAVVAASTAGVELEEHAAGDVVVHRARSTPETVAGVVVVLAIAAVFAAPAFSGFAQRDEPVSRRRGRLLVIVRDDGFSSRC